MDKQNYEVLLLNVLLTHFDKQEHIFRHTNEDFFQDITCLTIYRTAKKIFEEKEVVTNVDIYERDKSLYSPLWEILKETLGYKCMTDIYIKRLYDKAIERKIADAKTTAEIQAIDEFKNKYELKGSLIKHISADTENFMEKYEQRKKKIITTGYSKLDEIIGSFMGGDYIALGGGTGSGKTAFALNLANLLCFQDKQVLYFSLEMPLEQLQNRLVCLNLGLNANKLRGLTFTDKELNEFQNGLKGLKDWSLNIVCDYDLTLDKMKSYAEEQKKKKGLDFIILDYLGLMSGFGNKSLYEKTTILSRHIKLLASDLDVPILVLVQLNRNTSERQDKRPQLSDIRESGAIEQDADFVLFTYRDFDNEKSYTNLKEMQILVAKNRHGINRKNVILDFDLQTQLIKERW